MVNVASQQKGGFTNIEYVDAIHDGVTTTASERRVFRVGATYIYRTMNDIYADAEDIQQPDLGREGMFWARLGWV